MAKDENPVERAISKVGSYDGGDDGRGPSHGLEALAEHNEQEEGEDTRCGSHGVRGGKRYHLCRLACQVEHRRGQGEENHRWYGEERRQEDAALNRAGDCRPVAGTDRLSYHRVQHHQGAHGEDRQPEEVQVAQRHSRQGLGGNMADHDGVDHTHGHHPDLNDDHGNGEAEHGSKLRPPGQDLPGHLRGHRCQGLRDG
jgi:hypothetical protein